MKKITTLVICASISFSVMAQKKELREVEKLIKSSDFTEASAGLQGLEDLVTGTKYESQYYFLEGKVAFGEDENHDYVRAAKYFYKTLDHEIKINDKDYSEKAINYLNSISDKLYKVINASIKNKQFKVTGDNYQTLYKMNPGRKDLLDMILYCRIKSEDYVEAAMVTEDLLKLSTGETTYSAVNKKTLKNNDFFTKEQRDQAVKRETHISPSESEIDKEARMGYYRNLVSIYDQQGKVEKAIEKLEAAKKEFPNDTRFLEDYASMIYKTGDKEAYVLAIEEVLKLTPEKKDLWYNLGVVAQDLGDVEKASNAYDKVIALDSNYRNAYINKGLILLGEEKEMVKQLNENIGNKQYSVIKKKIQEVYKEALPLFEKAYEIEPGEGVKSTLKGLYGSLDMPEKAKAL